MAAVVTYWQLPEDEEEFLAFLDSTGDIVGVPTRWARGRDELTPQPITNLIQTTNPRQLNFGLTRHTTNVTTTTHENDEGKQFSIGLMENCLIG